MGGELLVKGGKNEEKKEPIKKRRGPGEVVCEESKEGGDGKKLP